MSINISEATSGQHDDSHRAIMRSTSVVALGTLSSRILGFVRDVVMAKYFGTGFQADAFYLAQKIPNLFRDLVGEGAMNAAVVPVLSEYKQHHPHATFVKVVNIVLVIATILLTVLTVIGIIFAPQLIRVIAPGFGAETEKFNLTVDLTRLMFPYLILIGLTAYSMGVLYTFRAFRAPAFSPILLNIAMIVGILLSVKFMADPIIGVSISVLVGGLLQLLAQIPSMMKRGILFKYPDTLKHEAARKIGKLLVPRVFGGGLYQLNVFIDTFCASLSSIVGAGGVSAIYFANRIVQFPMGIFTFALTSAVLPSFSSLAQKKDIGALKKMIVFALENIFFVMCPTTVILLLLANPIIRVLFERGAFGYESTQVTAGALAYFSIGLFSFGGIKILVTAFYALQDTKTPVKVAAGCLALNAVLNFVLMYPLKIGGIALASSISATMDFLVLFYILDKRLNGLDGDLLIYFAKVTIASALTGFLVYKLWLHLPIKPEAWRLIVVGTVGFMVYFFMTLQFKVLQAQKVWGWILRKK